MAKWIEKVNLPDAEGFYWARTSGMKFWNLIVNVYGDSPFFQIDAWEYTNHSLAIHANIYDICEFGPPISSEAPKILGKREDWQ